MADRTFKIHQLDCWGRWEGFAGEWRGPHEPPRLIWHDLHQCRIVAQQLANDNPEKTYEIVTGGSIHFGRKGKPIAASARAGQLNMLDAIIDPEEDPKDRNQLGFGFDPRG